MAAFLLRGRSGLEDRYARGFKQAKGCDNRGVKVRLTGLLAMLIVLAGCGYHVAGSATHIPANVRTVAVPIFASKAQAYGTETKFTDAVVRELNARTKLRVLTKDGGDADAVLRGTILSQAATPLTYDTTTGRSSSYLVTVTVSVVLTARDGHELYRNDKLTFRQQYQTSEDMASFMPEGPAAVERAAKDFAAAVVSDMLESY